MSIKAARKKKELPDWFPLTAYGKNHTAENWLLEIATRAAVLTYRDNLKEGKVVKSLDFKSSLLNVFDTLIQDREKNETLAKTPVTNFLPVREPTPFEMLFWSQMLPEKDYREAKLWATRLYREPQKWVAEFHVGGIREKLKSEKIAVAVSEGSSDTGTYYNDIMGKCFPLLVDLDCDDETLKLEFEIWLAGARNILGEKARQPIGEKDFAKWTRFKLLEAFDLAFWSEINKLDFTDAYIAKTLWPDFSNDDDFVDVTERYRKVTKPLVKEVFGWNFVQRLWRQVELCKATESLVARLEAEQKSG